MKLQITGASNFVNRMFEAAGNYQWAREFLKNSLEAKATKVEFGIEWQAVKKHGAYRRTICDDGAGMSHSEIVKFFSTLGEGAKAIGGIHENFGVGAKIASLPWNPDGVVVISYKEGKGSMIWIVLDEESGDYELVEFSNGGGRKSAVMDPSVHKVDGIDWDAIRPPWLKDHGTVVVLLGSEKHPDTVMGNPEAGEDDIKGLSVYLNSRFWDLSKVDIKVLELRSERKTHWPRGPEEADDSRRYNGRQIYGAKHYLVDVAAPKGKLSANNVLPIVDGRVQAEWYLWSGERPQIHSYAKRPGYIAVRYGDELFELTMGKVDFRAFGVVESKVQANLTIILEPQHYEASKEHWGIHPDQSRNRLIFTEPKEKGVAIPLYEWGRDFAENIPNEILEAIQEARGETAGTIEDEAYRKRLQDKFGSRWTVRRLVQARKADLEKEPVTNIAGVVESAMPSDLEIESQAKEEEARGSKKAAKVVTRKLAVKEGAMEGVMSDEPVDVPRYRFSRADAFTRPWHMAMWVPHDPTGPTVLINVESHVLLEIVRYHQSQYPDVFAEEVAETVRKVFGEIAACKIAHSQKLTRIVPEEELDKDYRSEAALTVGLMGLLAEEAVIAQRLGKVVGRKTNGHSNGKSGHPTPPPAVAAS